MTAHLVPLAAHNGALLRDDAALAIIAFNGDAEIEDDQSSISGETALANWALAKHVDAPWITFSYLFLANGLALWTRIKCGY